MSGGLGRGGQDSLRGQRAQTLDRGISGERQPGNPLAELLRLPQTVRVREAEYRPALQDRAREESACQRGTHQHARIDGPGGLAEHGHARRVATKLRDVLMHPPQSGNLIEQSVVTGRPVRRFAGQFGVGKETQWTEPVIDRDDHHPAFG